MFSKKCPLNSWIQKTGLEEEFQTMEKISFVQRAFMQFNRERE